MGLSLLVLRLGRLFLLLQRNSLRMRQPGLYHHGRQPREICHLQVPGTIAIIVTRTSANMTQSRSLLRNVTMNIACTVASMPMSTGDFAVMADCFFDQDLL